MSSASPRTTSKQNPPVPPPLPAPINFSSLAPRARTPRRRLHYNQSTISPSTRAPQEQAPISRSPPPSQDPVVPSCKTPCPQTTGHNAMPPMVSDSDTSDSDDDNLPKAAPDRDSYPHALRFPAHLLLTSMQGRRPAVLANIHSPSATAPSSADPRRSQRLAAQLASPCATKATATNAQRHSTAVELDSDSEIDPITAAHKLDFQRELRQLFDDRIDDLVPALRPTVSPAVFPFATPSQPRAAPSDEPWLKLQLSGSLFLDGGSRQRNGSYAFVCYHRNTVYLETKPLKRGESTNNFSEFKALLNALLYAIKRKLKRILVVTDSALVANFLKGINRITEHNLLSITLDIVALIPSFSAIFVSKIPSHQGIALENDVADALCTWSMSTEQSLTHCAHPKNLIPYSDAPIKCALESLPPKMTKLSSCTVLPKNACGSCHKTAHHSLPACPITRFAALDSFNSGQHCFGCLSPHHTATNCPLFSRPGCRPCPSPLIHSEVPTAEQSQRSRATEFFATNLDSLHFPQNCSRKQFADYLYTVLLALEQANSVAEVEFARKAWRLWTEHYRFEGLSIIRSRPKQTASNDPGNNSYPPPSDPEEDLAKRALKAAKMIPRGARVSDISKALRTGDKIPLSKDIKQKLSECYPKATPEERIIFEAKPLTSFAVDRNALARLIKSRSPYSHPGATGFSFEALQNFCRWTYGAEGEDAPDYRWDALCKLISKIMSGNATILSDMLLDVVGAIFNKNAEKPEAPFALRNLGIEESILRIAAALVFETVLPKALQSGHLSQFDLGAGRKAGAEIFGRIGATLARGSAAIAVFDVVKAFNFLRRADIMAAVADFNDPLLTAFVHYLFSKNSAVTFKCPITGDVYITTLDKGIHQGNPLSVFLFCLTSAFILKPFRAAHPDALVVTFVDDFQLAVKRGALKELPKLLPEFISLFSAHGLRFDLSDKAKSSVYSIWPLPSHIQHALASLGMRCQNEGISPCKIPHGTDTFMNAHASKMLAKLQGRYNAFQALWPILLRYDRTRKKPTYKVYEPYLNIVRLSFLSMSTYVLRTLHPSKCAAYCRSSTVWGLTLIRNVLPDFIHLPASLQLNQLSYPDLSAISARILQLPLTRGGLSLRLASSVADISYAASCLDCFPMMTAAADRLGIRCAQFQVPELLQTQRRIATIIPSLDTAFWKRFDDFEDDIYKEQLQKFLTIFLNSAECAAISTELASWPIYAHAFACRIDREQDHVSWPLNPKSRAHFSLGALNDSEFSRSLAIAILYPVIAPRICGCGQPIDPAGFHLLTCRYNSYVEMHDCVKFAVSARIKSLLSQDLAPFAVLVEQPVLAHYKLRDQSAPEGVARVADLVLSLHAEAQQQPVICDIVSCSTREGHISDDPLKPLKEAARLKRAKYAKYDIPSQAFFPLPFGRTNVLSEEVLDFCDFISRHFPAHTDVARKLRASFSRAICAGVARTTNLAFRRLQLSVAARVGVPGVSSLALRDPFLPVSPRRVLPKPPSLSLQSEARLRARLATVLRGCSEDLRSSSLPGARGQLSDAGGSAVED